MLRQRELSVTSIVAWSYPILAVGWQYAAWLAAWMSLGRRPVPSWDDPTRISIFVDCVYWVSGTMLCAFPLAVALGFLVIVKRTSKSNRPILAGIAKCALFATIWIGAFAFLRWDPLNVGMWYMD